MCICQKTLQTEEYAMNCGKHTAYYIGKIIGMHAADLPAIYVQFDTSRVQSNDNL